MENQIIDVEKPNKSKMTTELNSEQNNPCIKEQNMSFKCLTHSNYDPEQCQLHFFNYKKCKEFWNAVRTHRRREGIRPLLPPPEERLEIKERYKKLGHL